MRAGAWVAVGVALALVPPVTGAGADPPPIEFHRVHVPAGRLGDVPLGAERYVPMPLADFEAAVARARAAAGDVAAEPMPPATVARWRASLDEAGDLVGAITCEVGAPAAGPGRVLALGDLRVLRATRGTEPPRQATVCGLGSGLAVAVPEPGTYELEFSRAPVAAGAAEFRLPLVPALATSIALDLPPGLRPVLSGPAARRAVVVPPAAGEATPWRIEIGPAADITIAVEPRDRPLPPLAVWSEVVLSVPRAAVAAAVVPATPWRAGRIVLEQDAALRVTEVRAEGDDEPLAHESSADGRSLTVDVPAWLEGGRTPLVVQAVAPATGPVWRLPLLRAVASAWAGGGSVVRVDPGFAVREVELEDCRVVPPETAAAWPRPLGNAAVGAAEDLHAATYHVEQQGPAATLGVVLGPRAVSFDVARATTVEITPGAVLGRAACDIVVTGGEAFEISARVAPGWIIDAVDAVDRGAAGGDRTGQARGPATVVETLDWRVQPSPAGDALRIGLPGGAAGPRGIGLRIAGHRAGLVPGAGFTTADIDMVRFDGEGADTAVIDLRTDADAFVEIAGRPAGWFEVDGRLATLVEEGKARGRIRGGDRAGDVEARLVRRRPPLDVRVDVRLEPRDDVIVQSYTFDCRSDAGLESLVVDFAEPGGDGLAWRVESPAGVAVAARPLDPTEGGLASRSGAVAASWLVELTPAAAGPVRLRAVRSMPFARPLPMPLAWVEGAVAPGGTVTIAAPAGARPRLANRWLRELPGVADAAGEAAPAEYAYGAPLAGVAAELAPVAADADARAWAWRETVSCWCEESGATETESRFDLENEGRAAVSLALAPGRRLEGVSVGGVAVNDLEFGSAGGTWRIPLPPGRRRVEIVVRTLASGRPGRGAWRVDPVGCGLDVPVLDREVQLLVPPDLAVATSSVDGSGAGRLPWTVRLFGIGAVADGPAAATAGYRSEPFVATRDRGSGVLVVSRRLVGAAATLAAAAAGIAAFLRGRRRPAPACVGVAAAAVVALWLPPAFVPVARAAWWGGLVGLAWALRPALVRALRVPRWKTGAAAAAACGLALVVPAPHVIAGVDARVIVTPAAGGTTALVPEPLFRALATFSAPEAAAIRVLACTITAADAAPAWRLAIDVDADAGGSAVLDAGPGSQWLPPPTVSAGIDVRIAGREARLTAATPGRHTVELALVPAVERRGPVEIATARIPVAPTATLRIGAGDPAAGTVACECAAGGAAFMPAPAVPTGIAGAAFDVATADRVRLVRPVDPRDRLATSIRVASTVNELSWDVDGCRVQAVFELDPEAELLRSFVVRVDPRVAGLTAAAGAGAAPTLEPLGGGRVRVELPEAARGPTRIDLAARLPLADPVGVFEVPAIWLDGVPAEQRTTRLSAAAELDATLDPAPAAAATAADLAGRPATRVIVRRRRAPLRASQSLAVSFAPTGVGLALEARIESTAVALTRIPLEVPVGAAIDRVALVEDDPDARQRGAPVAVEWTRTAADRALVLVQRPRQGRFRLEVDARLARRPAPRGQLPVVRARLGAAAPLLVSWTAAPPLVVTVGAAAGAARLDALEIPEGAPDPAYELTVAEPAAVDTTPEPSASTEDAARVERAEVRAAFDARGRVHGVALIDVIAPGPVVRLQLPPGMRLFDVLVDGRIVAAEPRAVDVWDVPLGTAAWPRTILAVFAGDAGTALVERRPLELVAPRLEGLPVGEVLWSLRSPAGFTLKVAPPARPLDATALEAERVAARERVAAACLRAAAGATDPERGRLEALAALRGEGRGPAAEEAWQRVAEWQGSDGVTFVAAAEPLVIRAVPEADATTPARAAATVALVAMAGLAWTAAARGRATSRSRG